MSKLPLVALLALLTVSCLGDDFGDSLQGSWRLTSAAVDGTEVALIESHPVTITFEGERVSGTAACNLISGDFDLSGSSITFDDLSVTEMACFPPEVMELERAFIDALLRTTTVTIDDGLILTGPDAELVFDVVVPTPDASLTNTVWVLDGVVSGDSVSSVLGERATLELFTDGSLLGGTGCRQFSGSYEVSDGDVTVSEIVSDGHQCEPDLVDQDEHVLSVLQDGFGTEIRGNTLMVTGSGGLGLVYIADPDV